MRDHPVSACEHLARYFRVAALVGIEQRPQRQGGEPQHGGEPRKNADTRAGRSRRRRHASLDYRAPDLHRQRSRSPGNLAHDHGAGRKRRRRRERTNVGHTDDCRARVAPLREQGLERVMRRMPSSSACRVNTCELPASAPAAESRNSASAMFDSSIPSRPSSSSKVGKVVGICGQGLGPAASRGKNAVRRAYRSHIEAEFPLELEPMPVDLPAGGGVRLRRESEHALEAATPRSNSSASRPHRRRPHGPASARDHRYADRPRNPHRDAAHLLARAPADVRPGQEHAVHQGLQAVVLEDRGARHFLANPLRNTRRIARPVWSGPTEK